MPDKLDTAEPQKPRRRWFQFRLRTLLIVVELLGAACGYVAHEAQVVRERTRLADNGPGISLFLTDCTDQLPLGGHERPIHQAIRQAFAQLL